MNIREFLFSLCACLALSAQSTAAQNWATQSPPYGRPDATIDLRTREGVQLVKGEWRYSDVQIIQVDSKGPGPDLKPSGGPVKTYDYTPDAGMEKQASDALTGIYESGLAAIKARFAN